MGNLTTGREIRSFIASKFLFGELFQQQTLKVLLCSHSVFVKCRKVRNTAQLNKMADSIYAKLRIFNRLVRREKNLHGFHIRTA